MGGLSARSLFISYRSASGGFGSQTAGSRGVQKTPHPSPGGASQSLAVRICSFGASSVGGVAQYAGVGGSQRRFRSQACSGGGVPWASRAKPYGKRGGASGARATGR